MLDGSERVDGIIASAMEWDAMVGVGRRAWANNEHAVDVVKQWNVDNAARGNHITEPFRSDVDKYLPTK